MKLLNDNFDLYYTNCDDDDAHTKLNSTINTIGDANYLRLDTTNDPITNTLDLGNNNLTTTGNLIANLVIANIDWSYITNKFITAVDSVYFYMTGTTLYLNETMLNATIDARDDEGVTSVAAGNGLDFTTITDRDWETESTAVINLLVI